MSLGNLLEIRPADTRVIEPDGCRYDRSQVVRITERENGMEEWGKGKGRKGWEKNTALFPPPNKSRVTAFRCCWLGNADRVPVFICGDVRRYAGQFVGSV